MSLSFLRIILSVALGTLIGLVRDESWRKNSQRLSTSKFTFIKNNIPAKGLGGVRTYSLVALLGTVAGILSLFNFTILSHIIFIIFSTFILISYFLNYFDKNTFGLTTEMSIILVFILSFLLVATDIKPRIVITFAVFIAFIESLKKEVRTVIANFSRKEIIDIIKFVLTTVVILPFLPNQDFFLYQVHAVDEFFINNFGSDCLLHALPGFNPAKLWLIVVFVESINFLGYFLIKTLGGKLGFALTGFLGGLISSTAVTETMATQSRITKNKDHKTLLIISTILANLTSFIRVSLIAIILNFKFGIRIIIPMMSMTLYLIIWTLLNAKHIKKIDTSNKLKVRLNFNSPFAFKPALTFGLLFLFVSTITKLALFLLGNSGFLISSIVSAFSGMDAITINTASLVKHSVVDFHLGVIVITSAAIANLLIKWIFALLFGDKEFTRRLGRAFLIDSLIGIIATSLIDIL